MKFNEKLMKLRRAKGLSQEELGEQLNVTRQTISKWELGQTTPEMESLVEIGKLEPVGIQQDLSEEPSETPYSVPKEGSIYQTIP